MKVFPRNTKPIAILQFYIGNELVGKTDSEANAHRIKLAKAINGGSLYILAANKDATYIDSAELYIMGRCEKFLYLSCILPSIPSSIIKSIIIILLLIET